MNTFFKTIFSHLIETYNNNLLVTFSSYSLRHQVLIYITFNYCINVYCIVLLVECHIFETK